MRAGRAGVTALLVAALSLLLGAPARGRDIEGRLLIGIKLFRSLLAADAGLAAKVGPDGRMLLLVLYREDRVAARSIADSLQLASEGGGAATIKKLAFDVETTADFTLKGYLAPDGRIPAAVFLAEPIDGDALKSVIGFGIAHSRVVYSPFEGQAEKGVLGGLSVEARVQPVINARTLSASKLTLGDTFLKVAKIVGNEP